MITENELLPSTDVSRLIAIRADSLKRAEAAINELKDIESTIRDYYQYFSFGDRYRTGLEMSREPMPDITKNIDKALWSYMMEKTNMFDVMDAQTKEKFRKELENPPALTKETVAATFEKLFNSRGDMFENGIINLFKHLSWDYKTNLPQKFGKRIIKSGYASCWLGYLSIQYGRGTDELIDLERILLTLDSKPQPATAQTLPNLINEQQRDRNTRSNCYENEYLNIKLFRNGNAHITFKRLDLVEKMNKVIAKHYPGALPAPK